jgi:hypothetical protein
MMPGLRIIPFLCLLIGILVCPSASAKKETATAFVHVNLVPMNREAVIPDQTVLIEGKHIAAVGASSEIKLPINTNIISGAGAYLMPGLADMHMHLRDDWLTDKWPISPFKLFLANGVTTIRCFGPLGKRAKYAIDLRNDIEAGRLTGPRIFTCGKILYIKLKHPERIVIRQKYQGFDFIKPYSYLTAEEFNDVMSTARKIKIYVAGHIPFHVGLDGILAKGMNEIAHVEELLWELVDFDRSRYFENANEWMQYVIHTTFQQLKPFLALSPDEIEQRFKEKLTAIVGKLKDKGIPLCTTLVVDDVIVQKLFAPENFLAKPENRYLPDGYMNLFRQGKEKHQRQFKGGEVFAPFKYTMDKILLSRLKQAGITLLLATDCGTGGLGVVPGFSIHDELKILVENGFTSYEAIACGTIAASQVIQKMNGLNDFGTIEPGRRADLILLRENPLKDVAHIRNPLGVMAAGRFYDQAQLQQMVRLND